MSADEIYQRLQDVQAWQKLRMQRTHARHFAEKQNALFCCSVNFHHWRYGFESLSPVLTDKTAAISEGKFRRGRHILPRRLL